MAPGSQRPFWTTLPGLFTVVAALLTIVVGGYALLRGGEGATTVTPSPSPGSPVGTTGAASPGEPIDLENWEGGGGWFAIYPGDSVDLDEGASTAADLYWDADAAQLVSPAAGSAIATGRPTDHTPLSCQAVLTEVAEVEASSVEFADLLPGSPLCVRTDSGALAALTVVGIDNVGGRSALVIEGTSGR